MPSPLNSSAELKALAEQYGISEGKAYWVQMLTAADSTLSADVLAKLSINDLALLAEARNLKYDYVGTANDTAYIGLEKAKEIAIAKAGGGDVVSIELDVEDGVMVYEGEIVYNNVEYDSISTHWTAPFSSGEDAQWREYRHQQCNRGSPGKGNHSGQSSRR